MPRWYKYQSARKLKQPFCHSERSEESYTTKKYPIERLLYNPSRVNIALIRFFALAQNDKKRILLSDGMITLNNYTAKLLTSEALLK